MNLAASSCVQGWCEPIRMEVTMARTLAWAVMGATIALCVLSQNAYASCGSCFASGVILPEADLGLMLVSCSSTVRNHCLHVRHVCNQTHRLGDPPCQTRFEECMARSQCLQGSSAWPPSINGPGTGSPPRCPPSNWVHRDGLPCPEGDPTCHCAVRGTGSAPGTVEVLPPR